MEFYEDRSLFWYTDTHGKQTEKLGNTLLILLNHTYILLYCALTITPGCTRAIYDKQRQPYNVCSDGFKPRSNVSLFE